MGKKYLSLLVVLLMLLAIVPIHSYADVEAVSPPAIDGVSTIPAAVDGESTIPAAVDGVSTTPAAVDFAISTPAISGVTVPVTGETPVSAIAETTEYTATIVWSGTPVTFAADTAYTATITIIAKTGYTLTGVPADFFTVAGATATNAAGSGVVTAVFPKTAQDLTAPLLVSAATSSTGNLITLSFDKAMADPSADVGSFTVKLNGLRYNNIATTKVLTISSVVLNADQTKIDLLLAAPLQRGDIVTVGYTPGAVKAADTSKLDGFTAYSVTNTIPVIIDTNLTGTWQIFDHVGNWGELPFQSETPNSDDPRGSAFNRHIIISGNAVYFYGNGILPYKDFLYLPSTEAAAKSFTFNLDLGGIKYHSMEGGGFLFNTIIDNGLMSGYCALFTNYGKYAVELYQIDEVNVSDFHDGKSQYSNLGAGSSRIKRLGSFPLSTGNLHTITLESSSSTVDMWDGNIKLIDDFQLPKVYSNGVGIIGSYNSHHCEELSYFVFSNLNIEGIADLMAVLAGDQANLTFTAPEGATAVKVEQSTDAGATWAPAATINPITGTSTTATVTGLSRAQTYYFRLDITGGKYNGYSRVATALYTVGPITNLTATGGDGIANLTFTPPAGASALTAMQSSDGGESWIPAVLANPLSPTSSAATVTGLTNGQQYTFKIVVSAELGGGDSNVVNAIPSVQTVPAAPASEPVHYHTLSVKQVGEGDVLPGVGNHEYSSGIYVLLKAIPAEGYLFEGWTGDAENPVYMDQNKTVTAVFKPIVQTVTVIEPAEEPIPGGSAEPEPTEPEVIEEEETVPAEPLELPRTGGLSSLVLYGIGGAAAAAGLYTRKRIK